MQIIIVYEDEYYATSLHHNIHNPSYLSHFGVIESVQKPDQNTQRFLRKIGMLVGLEFRPLGFPLGRRRGRKKNLWNNDKGFVPSSFDDKNLGKLFLPRFQVTKFIQCDRPTFFIEVIVSAEVSMNCECFFGRAYKRQNVSKQHHKEPI